MFRIGLLLRLERIFIKFKWRHESRNVWTNRAGLGHKGFLRPVIRCVVRKFKHLKNKGTFTSNSVLNTALKNIATVRRSLQVATACKQSSSTVELCWPNLRRSTRLARPSLSSILFVTRPSIVIWKNIHSFACLFVYLFIHSFTHSFIHSFTHSFIHSFIHYKKQTTNMYARLQQCSGK